MHQGTAFADLERDGFCRIASPFSTRAIEVVEQAVEMVLAGEYETGIAPTEIIASNFDPADTLRDLGGVHLCNRDIYDFICQPALGEAIAQATGAQAVQIWGVQLFHKPPAVSRKCNVGWHQDFFFHQRYFEPDSRIFTAWIAISDVEEDCGPMRMIPGSHRWGFYDIQSAPREFVQSHVKMPEGESWREVSILLRKGALSLHHTLTYHGSYSNTSDRPRRSLALRVRTERSTPCPPRPKVPRIDFQNLEVCPVIHGDPELLPRAR